MARTPKSAPAKRGRGGKALSAAKAIAEAKAEQEKKIDTTIAMPSTNDVINAAKRIKSGRKQAKEIGGVAGDHMRKFAEEKNGDKVAMNVALKFDGMSDDKLHTSYHHLLKYFDDLGITQRATAQGRLDVDQDQTGEDDDKTTTAGPGGFQVVEGGRPMAEAAGG